MTESEKIAYAKTFIDKMANGINPLNNMPARAEDLINQVRISRCLFYVSEILGRAIDAESKREAREHKKKVKTRAKNRAPFTITAEQLLAFSYTELPLSITAFTKKVNFLVWQELEASRMKRLNYRQIIAWMLKTGLLEYRETAVGVFRRFPTADGEAVGIVVQNWERYGNSVPLIYLTEKAQRFIVDNFDAVLACNESDPESSEEEIANDEMAEHELAEQERNADDEGEE